MNHPDAYTAQDALRDVRDEAEPAPQWTAVEMGTVGALRLEELPQTVREHIDQMRERCEVLDREGRGWEALIFVDEPHGRLWRIGIGREEDGPWELEVSHVVYREIRL